MQPSGGYQAHVLRAEAELASSHDTHQVIADRLGISADAAGLYCAYLVQRSMLGRCPHVQPGNGNGDQPPPGNGTDDQPTQELPRVREEPDLPYPAADAGYGASRQPAGGRHRRPATPLDGTEYPPGHAPAPRPGAFAAPPRVQPDPYHPQAPQGRPGQQPRQPSFTPNPQYDDTPPGRAVYQGQPQEPYVSRGPQHAAQTQNASPPDRPGYPPRVQAGNRASRRAPGKRYGLRGAEPFWYVLGCISFGVAYFAKLPAKKAACEIFSELQLDGQGASDGYSLRLAETFWYVLMCLGFGGGYFAKVSVKKALWELVGMVQSAPGEYAEAIGQALFGPGVPRMRGY